MFLGLICKQIEIYMDHIIVSIYILNLSINKNNENMKRWG